MDIQTKDGILLRGIPEGTPDDVIKERILKLRAEGQSKQQPPTPFRSSGEKALSAGEEFVANPYGRALVGAAKPFIGTGQVALNAVGQGEGINRAMTDLKASTDKAREYVGSRGVDLADMAGQGAALALPVSRMASAATTAGRIGQGMLVGGATGATAPVEAPGNYWGQKAAQTGAGIAVGGLAPGAWELSKALGRGVRNVAQPYLGEWGADQAAGRLANTAAGDLAPQVRGALASPQTIVPGSNPTAGQAASGTNSAEFAALQNLAAERAPSVYSGPGGIEGAQNQARIAALRSVGKTPADLATAEGQRAGDAAANYGAAYQQQIKADPALLKMSDNPYFKDAVGDASKLAAANGVDPKTNLTQFLHYVKISLDKQLSRTGDTALASTEKNAVQSLKKELTDWIGTKNPAYETARSEFAAASKPINQMEVGQYLEGKLVPAISDDAKQRAAAYAQALRDAPGTIKRATGQPRFDSMGQMMDPTQLQTLRGVKADLERDALTQALSQKGMAAARERIGQAIPEAPPSGMFSPLISVARGAYNRLSGNATDKILDDLAVRMQNPQQMARIMESAKPFERKALVDALMRVQAAGAEKAAEQGARQ